MMQPSNQKGTQFGKGKQDPYLKLWPTSQRRPAQHDNRNRQIATIHLAHPDYGCRVAEGLGLDLTEVKNLAASSRMKVW